MTGQVLCALCGYRGDACYFVTISNGMGQCKWCKQVELQINVNEAKKNWKSDGYKRSKMKKFKKILENK